MPRNPQNSNPILCECDFAKVAHSRARPPGFSRSSVQWSYVVRPRQLFQAGIAILARKVTMDDMPSWKFLNGRRRDRSASARPAGRVLGDRHVEFSLPMFSMSQDQTGPRSTCRPRPDPFECPSFPSPMQRPGTSIVGVTLSVLFERCTGLAPQIPPGPRPTSERQTGTLLRALEVGAVEWPTRML